MHILQAARLEQPQIPTPTVTAVAGKTNLHRLEVKPVFTTLQATPPLIKATLCRGKEDF